MAAKPGNWPWEVKSRCLMSFDEQLQLDSDDYVGHQSCWSDSKTLLLTPPTVYISVGWVKIVR
jgi:lipopolysaccharide/colanic/teichoic acid biosynthesis glycosyltransferase